MARPESARSMAHFAGFEFDPHAGQLRAKTDGSAITLAEQPSRLLSILLERPGELVTRQELQTALWPDGTIVEFEHSISAAMNRLRQALGDSAQEPEYIETLAKRGYRWKLPVEWTDGSRQTTTSTALRHGRGQVSSTSRLVVLGSLAVLLIVSAILLWRTRTSAYPDTPLPVNLHPLTSNSFENRVRSGAISADGKYLAYSDANGIRIRLVASGEIRVVPQPEEIKDKQLQWDIVGTWLPDSSAFIANAHPPDSADTPASSQDSSIWSFPVWGAHPRLLRDHAVAYSLSFDGSLLAFGTNSSKLGTREIWLMTATGDHPHKLIETAGEASLGPVYWSKDGNRILYMKTDPSGSTVLSSNLQSGPPTTVLDPRETAGLIDFFWRPNGQMIFSVEESDSTAGNHCNLWGVHLSAQTGAPLEKPRKLTNWSGFCLSAMSATSDDKKLAFLRWTGNLTSFIADLGADGKTVGNPRHFPLSESSEAITGWTPDSKAVFLISDRSGEFGIYKQHLDQDTAETIVSSGYSRNPCLLPGGAGLIYLGVGEKGAPPGKGVESVMRVPAAGGPPQQLFVARPRSLLTCARIPSGVCVIAEPSDDGRQLIVTTIDPLLGRGLEIFRFSLTAGDDSWFFELSPSGTRFAITRTASGPIYVVSSTGEILQQVKVRRSPQVLAFAWDVNETGFFVTAGIENGKELLHVDMRGNTRVLWNYVGATGETLAKPSPDGHLLAFNGWTTSGNIWTLENF